MNISSLFKASGLTLAIAAIAGSTNAAELEEIIVTAQKRAESLQDVPVSLTAISGSKIEDASMNSFAELSTYVPNLSITENAVNTIIEMRGISVGANQSFEQSVGVFVGTSSYEHQYHVLQIFNATEWYSIILKCHPMVFEYVVYFLQKNIRVSTWQIVPFEGLKMPHNGIRF